MKNNLKSIVMIATLGFFIPDNVYSEFPKHYNNNFEDADFLTPKCYNTSMDYNLRVRKDSHNRLVLDYFVCVNSKSSIKDLEYYIDNIPVWSISVDSPGFGMAEPLFSNNFLHGIILESIRDFKKGSHKAEVILYGSKGEIERKIKTFELEGDVRAKYYKPFSGATF
ncbi:hypothetical protein HYX19_03880 [Candidatus Woesearchaeota archaeon]|nr:hypothetical protein [Candidatus Woesearchaeota archaeon]